MLRSVDCSRAIDDGTYRLFRNVGNYKSTLRNIPEDRIQYDFDVTFYCINSSADKQIAAVSGYVVLGINYSLATRV